MTSRNCQWNCLCLPRVCSIMRLIPQGSSQQMLPSLGILAHPARLRWRMLLYRYLLQQTSLRRCSTKFFRPIALSFTVPRREVLLRRGRFLEKASVIDFSTCMCTVARIDVSSFKYSWKLSFEGFFTYWLFAFLCHQICSPITSNKTANAVSPSWTVNTV